MSTWVKFREIKEGVRIAAVLEHYQWNSVRRRGPEHLQGRCPIHGGQRVDAFHVDLGKNIFHCFSCQAGGSVLDLVAAIERCSIREAALWLAQRFGGKPAGERVVGADRKRQRVREKERVLAPLSFTLRPIDSAHPYLRQRGIGGETATHFGVGYYGGPGLMHHRVVMPIHDQEGRLVAYAGRSVDGAPPKYRMPAGFHKSDVLFNLHRAIARGRDRVIVVEGFFDCMKVHQAGQACVVALMGCCLSAEQERLLAVRFGTTVLMLDADPAGRRATLRIADQLANRCLVEVIRLPEHHQPDQLSREEIQRLLSRATGVLQHPRER